jgi:hypothetical protein
MAMAGHWPFNLLTATVSTPTETPGIIPVTEPYLRRELGLVARWERIGRKGEGARCDPPAAVAAQMKATIRQPG